MIMFENILKKYGKIATFMLNSAFIQSYVVRQLLMKILLRKIVPGGRLCQNLPLTHNHGNGM